MRKLISITTIYLLGFTASAQQEYSFTQYFNANSFYNPAAVGTKDGHVITGLFRRQWTGYENTPLTGGLVYDYRLSSYNMGVGGYVFSDRIGATIMTNVVANYSYTLQFENELRLAFGIDGGVDIYSTDYSRLVYWDNDEMFDDQKRNQVVPRAGAGAHFYGENFYVGLSIPRLLNFNNGSPISISADNLPSIVSNYYLSGGYRFDVGDNYSIQTNVLGKYTGHVKPQGDINVMGMYKNMIGLGVGYKSLGFGSAFIQYIYDDVVRIGYAFDLSVNEMAKYSNGTHEIMIQYSLPQGQSRARQ